MQRYFARQKFDNCLILEDSDWHHIWHVMRMKQGDQIEVVYDYHLYLCRVDGVNEMSSVSIVSELGEGLETIPEVTLVVPILKEQKLDYILQKSTELGVAHIKVVAMERTVVKLDEKKEKKVLRWNRICKEASEQSKRCQVPDVEYIANIKDLGRLDGLRFVCSTIETKKNIKFFLQSTRNCDKLNIVIGPEGGLSMNEEECFKQMGFIPVTLGKRIMRVETVPLFVLSILNYEYME